ncbi:MAG: EAL domain-containing protein [Sneathiellales bacterium]|nr:EAL domain-containing protein [Sneathiellales bacterium]
MKILIIDDDEVDYLTTNRKLKRAFRSELLEIDWLQDARKINYPSLFKDYDVCLIDQNLGSIQGLNVIQNMHRAGCMCPMILLTGSMSEKTDHQASEFGATDFLLKKDITATLLNRSIRFAIAQKKHEKKLTELAYTDGLTGIANRKRLDEFMENVLTSASRSQTGLGLVLIDLDDFKLVNDSFGHLVGDDLLKQVAERLKAAVRETDLVARLGGDEFGIGLCLMRDEMDIEPVLEKIRNVFSSPFQLGTTQINCTASIGAISRPLKNSLTFPELFRRADLSLYSAKFKGKNSVQLYPRSDNGARQKTARLPSRIQRALKKQEFHVFYQPKIDLLDQTVCGTEALIRWLPEEGLPILPADFIPAAELSGDIMEIGAWVLETACEQVSLWRNHLNLVLPVAVNMSPIQIGRTETIDLIQHVLKKYDMPPNLLEIEITETASLLNSRTFIQNLTAISDLGCKITIDDFGIGYSSFQRFMDLPISALKIDQSFIAGINHSAKADAICKAITVLAHNLQLSVTAEGVETAAQLSAIEDLDCQFAQGFFIKEPVSSEQFIDWHSAYRSSLSPQASSYLN